MMVFSRKTEYALIAIEHMTLKSLQGSLVSSAREIADTHKIPYTITAKVLQKLAGKGFVKSSAGINGGYVLVKKPEDISIIQIVEIFEGAVAIADCFKNQKITCPQFDDCNIKSPLYEINHKIYQLLAQTSLADLSHKTTRIPRL